MNQPVNIPRCYRQSARLRFALKIGALVACASAPAVRATTFTFEGNGTTSAPTSGNFSGFGFSPTLGASGGTPVSTTADTVSFGGTTAYTGTDDFDATIQANVLAFSNTSTVGLLQSTATGAANSITLGGTSPTINLGNTAGAAALVTNNLNLILGANLAFAGAGSMTMTGTINDNGGGFGLTQGGTGTLTLNGATSYTGVTTINSGTILTGASNVLSSGSALVFGGTTTAVLNMGSTAQTVASISAPTYVSGAGITASGYTTSSLTVGSDNTSTVFNDVISHTTLIKNGTGTLTIGGTPDNSSTALIVNAGTVILAKPSSSTGHVEGSGLTINGGTVQFATGGNGVELYVTSPIVVNAGTLDLNGQSDSVGYLSSTTTGGTVTNTSTTASMLTVGTTTTAVTYSGNITDNGANGGTLALVKLGTGVQTLSGTNTYSSGTTVSAGTLELGTLASLPNSGTGTTVASGATLAAAVGGTSTITSANVATLGANATFTSGGFLGVDTTGGNFTESNNLGGSLGLNKLGVNTLTLSGANTYTGTTTVSNGTLVASGVGTLPSGGTVAINAGTLVASGPVGTLPTNSTVNMAGVLAGATPVILSIQSDAPGTIAQGNNINITSTSNGDASGPTIDVRNNGGTTTGSVVAFGALNDGAAGTEFKTAINFTGANGYTESFTSLSLPGVGTSTFLLNPTTTSVSIGTVSSQIPSGGDSLNLGGTSTGNIITGVISNSGASGTTGTTVVATEGSGAWTLAGANTYTGTTSFAGSGTLILTGSIGTTAAPGTAGGQLLGQGGSFVYSPTAGSGTVQTFPSYNASVASSSISNTVAGSTLNIGAIARNNSSDLDFAQTTGAITTTTANVNGILGPYATFGTGANTSYATGATTAGTAIAVAAYTAAMPAANATILGTNAATNYDLAAGGTAPGNASAYTIRYTGGTDTLTSSTSFTDSGVMNIGGGTLTIGGGTLIPGATAAGGTARELNVSTPNGNVVISSNITNNGTATSSFTAAGSGTVTLTGANTYTGITFVEGGALVLNTSVGTTASTGNVTVYANGTLLGAGTAPTGLTAIMAGGTLAPGSSVAANGKSAATPGMLSLGALTLNNIGNGTLPSNVNILLGENNSASGANAGSAYSQVKTNGVTALGGNLFVTLGSTLTVGDKFFIIDNTSTSATSGTFANIGATGSSFTSGGDTFTINYADNGDAGTLANDVSLTVSGIGAVPEPSTYVGGLMAVAMALWVGIRRRSSSVNG